MLPRLTSVSGPPVAHFQIPQLPQAPAESVRPQTRAEADRSVDREPLSRGAARLIAHSLVNALNDILSDPVLAVSVPLFSFRVLLFQPRLQCRCQQHFSFALLIEMPPITILLSTVGQSC